MRYETKYRVNFQQYYLLYNYFKEIMNKDENLKEKDSYPIFSLYYDTPELNFYYDKIDGHYHHIKFRARKYSFDLEDDSPFFLEAKLKKNEIGDKFRAKVDRTYREILDFKNWNVSEFNDIIYKTNVLPTVGVFYNRTSLEDSNKLRITFDKDILAIPINQTKIKKEDFYNKRILEEEFCLMEIKYPLKDLPMWLKEILSKTNVEQASFSKYTESIDFLQKRGIYEF